MGCVMFRLDNTDTELENRYLLQLEFKSRGYLGNN